jgi:hypothetical protein
MQAQKFGGKNLVYIFALAKTQRQTYVAPRRYAHAKNAKSAKMQDRISGKAFEELQRRVRARVAELGEKPAPLALRYGLGKDYIRDIVAEKPRKKSLSMALLPRFAAALGVDEEYLTLKQSTPRRQNTGTDRTAKTAPAKIKFGGRLKAGRWEAAPVETEIPLLPSVSAPGLTIDIAYVQEDETLAAMGIRAGAVLYAEQAGKSEPGDVVVIRRTMGPLVELSARVKTDTGQYEARPLPGAAQIAEPSRTRFKEAEVAVVRIAQMLLGRKPA